MTVYCIAGTFSCPVCHRGFSDRSNCNRHIRNQHGNVQTVDCNICGATLKNIESLKDHKRNKHSDSAYLKWIYHEIQTLHNILPIYFLQILQGKFHAQCAACLSQRESWKGTLEISTKTLRQWVVMCVVQFSRTRKAWSTITTSFIKNKWSHFNCSVYQSLTTNKIFLDPFT